MNNKQLSFKRIILMILSLLAVILTGIVLKNIIFTAPLDYSIGMHILFAMANLIIIMAFAKQKMYLFILFPICSLLMFLVSFIMMII